MSEMRTYRVECEDRITREVVTEGSQAWTADHPGDTAEDPETHEPRDAVALIAERRGWAVTAIVGPGDTTRAERQAALTTYFNNQYAANRRKHARP